MSPPPSAWLRAFLLTVLIEVPLVLALTRESPVPARRRLALAFFAQLTTHPLVWYVFPKVGLPGLWPLTLSELWAWWGEALFYLAAFAPLRPWRAIGVAGVANGVSFGLGLLVPRRFFFD
ncbi:MAG: hypothetical protein MUF34_05490 [Polyangiaceae bacterium]|jgi:hypothetical protein|nr:hypothetical protein [Polyangiaceae bacterium]